MSFADSEQIRHDRVNLVRLVRRLEDAVESKEWYEDVRKPTRATWIKTQGMLQVRSTVERIVYVAEGMLYLPSRK